MRKLKILFMMIVSCFLISKTFSFDTNFYFSPVSGTKMKLYCEVPVYMMIDGGQEKFNGFQANIYFDSNVLTVKTGSIHSEFSDGNNFVSGNFYEVGGAMSSSGYKQGILTGVSFKIITKANVTGIILSFVDKYGNAPIFGSGTTDDNISLNGYDRGGRDILSSVDSVNYDFVALPCIPDGDQPRIENISVDNGADKVPYNQVISFLTYDWNASKKVSHWFAGNSVDDLSHYVLVPTANNVDNQEGVNSGSISVKVSCDTCSTPQSNVPASLSIFDWGGTTSINALTWDSERRGYNISFDAPFPYEIEKKVTVNISVADNPNENGETHMKNYSFSFNAPVPPVITRDYPSMDTFVSPSSSFAISFYMSDDWAGVDTGSVSITIPQIMSGEEIILPSYVYSGSDLNFQLVSGGVGLGNAGSYIVSFYPKQDFPISTEITLNVEGSDLAGTTKNFTSNFTTRPGCNFFGCVDNINIIGGDINQIFSGLALIVTGTNPGSVYPYLTGENNEILMCGGGWNGINFDGNVSIYDVDGNGIGGNSYTNNELFITGLNFVYEDGVIKVQ